MSEQTTINNLVVDVYHLNKALEKGDLDLDYLAKATNTLVHTNQVHDFSLDFVDKQTLANVDLDVEEIRRLGNDYIHMIVDPESVKSNTDKLIHYLNEGDKSKPLVILQKFRHTLNGPYNVHLTVCNYNQRLNTYFSLDFGLADLGSLSRKMVRVHEQEEFSRKHYLLFQTLSPREKQVLGYIAQGFTDKEIGELLQCSSQTARTHRKHIRQKLRIHSIAEAIQFALAYDLI